MVYALYSEGFRLGGENSQRAADTGEVPLDLRAGQPEQLRGGPQEPVVRQQASSSTLSAFLMEWDDIQLHIDRHRAATISGAWWIEGNFNGGEAEQKGVEFNGQWYATDRLNFEWSVFLASPEFTEDTF